MNYLDQVTVPVMAAQDWSGLHRAVVELQDREAIRVLVALYSIARDDNDLDRLVPFFAPDGAFEIGGRRIVGHPALREFYTDNMRTYRTSLHVTHTHVIDVRGTEATGIVTGHAELAFASTLMMAAYRYADAYVKVADRWQFAERRLAFMYCVPADQLAGSFGNADRIRWPGSDPAAADIPEGLATYPGLGGG